MAAIELILLMLLAIVASGYLARALPVPVPLPLIQIALGALIEGMLGKGLTLEPQTFFLMFVAPLLFFEGWRVPNHAILQDKVMILQLALGLVVFTVLCGGLLIHWLIPAMPIALAFALAAILAPTDPVAVCTMGASKALPKRIVHLLEGEALLNDASGLVCFRFAVVAAMTGHFSLAEASLAFLWQGVGGVGVGVLLTLGVSYAQRWLARHVGEESGLPILLSLLIPFGAYLLAEHIQASGILAAVAGGITMSQLELRPQAPATTRLHRTAVWDMIQFVLNGMVFVLLGEQLPTSLQTAMTVAEHGRGGINGMWLIGAALGIQFGLFALRFVWVWVSLRMTVFKGKQAGNLRARLHGRVVLVMSLAGVRGAVTLAGVMTLPYLMPGGAPFPMRPLVVYLATAVIVSSLLIASLTLPLLLGKLTFPDDGVEHEQEALARKEAALAALEAIRDTRQRLSQDGFESAVVGRCAEKVMETYQTQAEGGAPDGEALSPLTRQQDQSARAEHMLRIAAWTAERDRVMELLRQARISDEISRKLVREIDLQESREV